MRRFVILLTAVALVVGACTSSEPSASTTGTAGTTAGTFTGVGADFDPGSISFIAALDRPGTCAAVLDRFKQEALARVGPYGLGDGGYYWGPVFADDRGGFAEEALPAAGATVTTMAAAFDQATGIDLAGGDGVAYSGSNVQVAGVDEPDIAKTDGSRIVAIVDGRLFVIAVDGGTATLAGALRLDGGWGHRLLVSGDRAFVFSTADVWALPAVFAAEMSDIAPEYQPPSSLITEIDLSDAASPRVVRTLKVDGAYLTARSIGDTVRVVVTSYPSQLPFVYPSGPAAEAFAEQANRQIIEDSTIEQWLPSFTLATGDEITASGLLADCERVHFPAEFAGFSTLSVLTLDLGSGLSAGGATSVVADGETVYASTESLYVATNVWVPGELIGDTRLGSLEESWSTAIHRFDISGDGPAEYLASGSVEGHLLNQFSMDERDGRLRVAVTDGAPWGFSEDSESFIVVLNTDGDRLVEVGRVGDMGRGERIFSVRFVGDTAYVVTFRQVDPLYVVDLSDPTAPVVAGELKIPGYSSYLHPLGDGRVLGVGQEATEEGFTTGTKVTLFDVSDPANPVETGTWTAPNAYSDAEWDHLAFLYWAPTATAVLPVQIWQDGFAGAVVLGTDDGLRERGRIAHDFDELDPVVSGCDPVSDDALQEWIVSEGIVVQRCGEDDLGGATARWCDVFEGGIVRELGNEFFIDPDSLELAEGERIEVCWPNYELRSDPILRSIVIGDTLWTLSNRSLQGNDLATLETTGTVSLG